MVTSTLLVFHNALVVECSGIKPRRSLITNEEREGSFLVRDPWGVTVLFVSDQSLKASEGD
jgi:hypothetical protein